MKVLIVSHSCVIDVNQQVFAEMERLPHCEVALLVPANWKSEYTGEPMQATKLPEANFAFFTAPVVRPGSIPLHFYPRLPWTGIRQFAPDIVLSQQEPYSLSGAQALHIARRLKAPLVFQTNQNIVKRYPPPFGWIEAASLREANVAVAYSEEARQVLVQKGRTGPTDVVPYATDVSRFEPRDSQQLRTELGIAGAPVIGYLGRLVPEKGLDTLLEAAALLKQTPFKLLFVGGGAQESALQAQAQRLGIADRVVWQKPVPHHDAARYLACLDIFVLPSRTTPTWKEQFGRVIMESLACHIPLVGSDSGAIPHLLKATGGGLIFPEGDADALAAALRCLLTDGTKRIEMGRRGAQAVQATYSCEAVAQQLQGILQAASEGKRS